MYRRMLRLSFAPQRLFHGRWLRRSQLYPTWLVRVFRHDRIRYERLVNPVAIVDGETGTLNGHLIHHPFSHVCLIGLTDTIATVHLKPKIS